MSCVFDPCRLMFGLLCVHVCLINQASSELGFLAVVKDK